MSSPTGWKCQSLREIPIVTASESGPGVRDLNPRRFGQASIQGTDNDPTLTANWRHKK